MDDFHVIIEEILFEGTMKEGKIAFTTTLKGIWVNSIGGVDPPQEKWKSSGIHSSFWK